MGQPLSMEFRSRVLAAIDDGTRCRAAATWSGVAPSTAIRWQRHLRATGGVTPKPQGGNIHSRKVEAWRSDILTIWEARKDISLEKPRAALADVGLQVSFSGL